MSHEYCSFCETLPGTANKGWGGKPGKCPVCKSELWVSQNGATYRLDDTLPAALNARWFWAGGAGVATGVCLIVGFGLYAFRSGEMEKPIRIELASLPDIKVIHPLPESTGPTVRVRTTPPTVAASVKPLPTKPIVPVATPPVVAAPSVERSEKPSTMAPAVVSNPPIAIFIAADLEGQLLAVPQIDLDADYLKKSKEQIAERAKEIAAVNKKTKDAFVRTLMKERDDLAGLPFLLGDDCAIPDAKATSLATGSLRVRELLSTALTRGESVAPTKSSGPAVYQYMSDHANQAVANALWSKTLRHGGLNADFSISALRQILAVENHYVRLGFAEHLKERKNGPDSEVVEALVNLAIFDLDFGVRQAAVTHLREQPKEKYLPALKKALRYPWLPVVHNAVQALVKLEIREIVPDMVAMLDEADPGAPFAVKGEDGKEKMVVRELVRINHHRNCMLCHAPFVESTNPRDSLSLPVGPCPSAADPLPPGANAVYYAARRGVTLVRADITYLRQDFSLRQPVDDAGKWPALQRFDFLVRTRAASSRDIPQNSKDMLTPHKHAIMDGLAALTGRNAAPTAEAWRAAIAQPASGVDAKAKPAR